VLATDAQSALHDARALCSATFARMNAQALVDAPTSPRQCKHDRLLHQLPDPATVGEHLLPLGWYR